MRSRILNNIIFIILCAQISFCAAQTFSKQNNDNKRRLASQYERAKRYDLAADIYISLCDENPHDISAYISAKRCLLNLNDYSKLEQLIYNLKKSYRHVRFEIDLAEISYLRGEEQKAMQLLESTITDNSTNIEAYTLAGRFYLNNKMYKKALNLFLTGRKKIKNQDLFIFELAAIYQQTEKYELLVFEYVKYVQKYPGQISFIQSRFAQIINEPKVQKIVFETLEKKIQLTPETEWIRKQLLGYLYTITGNYEQAFTNLVFLENYLAKQSTKELKEKYLAGQYLFQFANTAIRNNSIQYAEQAYRYIINNLPAGPFMHQSKLGLAYILEKQEKYNLAIQAYESFIKEFPNAMEAMQAFLRIGDIWYSLGDYETAADVYKRMLDKRPSVTYLAQAYFNLSNCALQLNQFKMAKKYLNNIKNLFHNQRGEEYWQSQYKLAELSFYQQKPHEALESLKAFEDRFNSRQQDYSKTVDNDALELQSMLFENQSDTLALSTMGNVQLLLFQNQQDSAIHIIENYLTENSYSMLNEDFYLLLSDLYIKKGESSKSLALLNKIYSNEDSILQDMALVEIAKVYDFQIKDKALAVKNYELLLTDFPASIYLEYARERIREIESGN